MLKLLDRYAYIGVGRDDGKEQGEYAAIFYNKERIELLENGDFWLAEQTDSPQKGWDAACIRICTWGKLISSFFSNVHIEDNILKFCITDDDMLESLYAFKVCFYV